MIPDDKVSTALLERLERDREKAQLRENPEFREARLAGARSAERYLEDLAFVSRAGDPNQSPGDAGWLIGWIERMRELTMIRNTPKR